MKGERDRAGMNDRGHAASAGPARAPVPSDDRVRFWRRGFYAAILLVVVALGSLAPHLTDSAELVRLRNALLIDVVEDTRFDWTPATMPADFARERGEPTPAFSARVATLGLEALPSDWDRALAIARHMLAQRRDKVGSPIQSDLERTYQVIRQTGQGYCGDYADVFSALALAAGLHVRSWAFSFDGFGGNGHIFNEVWDAQDGRWKLVDVFNNYYMTGADGTPMSALEFRSAMLKDPASPRLVPIDPDAKPVFKHEVRAREFYQRGLSQWYLWWGNGVFSYDDATLVRTLGTVSRSLEQLGGIAQDVHPRIRVLGNEQNRAFVQAMQRLKAQLLAVMVVALLGLLLAAVCAAGWARARRRRLARTSASARPPEGGARSLPEGPPRRGRAHE